MGERPGHWTRFTNRLNIIAWALPIPRRAQAALSRVVYRNPPMPAARAAETIDALQTADVEALVIGSWGADALVRERRRTRRDLDLIVDRPQVDDALTTLHGIGYEEWYRLSPAPLDDFGLIGESIVLRDAAMRAVDLHSMDLGGADLTLAQGSIEGREVHCAISEIADPRAWRIAGSHSVDR
jgi:hypothetical protein